MAEKERQTEERVNKQTGGDEKTTPTVEITKPINMKAAKGEGGVRRQLSESSSEEEGGGGGTTSNNVNGHRQVTSSGGRGRQMSSSSGSEEDELQQGNSSRKKNDGLDDKRQRTSSPANKGFVIPGIAASPPRFVSLEEIMKAANGVTNMALAHEIAVDRDFKLEKVQPPESSLHSQVKEIVHRAFWDVFEAQLQEDPPNYDHAMILLSEIKENLESLLLPHHTKVRGEIEEVLDVELIRQQADNGTLDFGYYAQYIISVMAKLCAPVRDAQIQELMKTTDVVPMYKGIFKTLDAMKLDMANFTIQQMRPHIQQHSVEYEKQKFAEFLETIEDGLEWTRMWLQRSMDALQSTGDETAASGSSSSDASEKRRQVNAVISKAYMAILEWDDDWPFPETLTMDQGRFLDLRDKLNSVALVASMLLVTYNTVGASIAGIAQFKEQLKEHVTVILNDTNPKGLLEAIPNVTVQVVKEVNECLTKHGFPPLDDELEQTLRGQIDGLAQPDSRVRTLVKQRVLEFIGQVVSSNTANPIRIPPGLSAIQPELARVTGHFLRLVAHNRAVFGDYYVDLIGEASGDAHPVTKDAMISSGATSQKRAASAAPEP